MRGADHLKYGLPGKMFSPETDVLDVMCKFCV